MIVFCVAENTFPSSDLGFHNCFAASPGQTSNLGIVATNWKAKISVLFGLLRPLFFRQLECKSFKMTIQRECVQAQSLRTMPRFEQRPQSNQGTPCWGKQKESSASWKIITCELHKAIMHRLKSKGICLDEGIGCHAEVLIGNCRFYFLLRLESHVSLTPSIMQRGTFPCRG